MTLIDMSVLERSREENPKPDNWFSCALNRVPCQRHLHSIQGL